MRTDTTKFDVVLIAAGDWRIAIDGVVGYVSFEHRGEALSAARVQARQLHQGSGVATEVRAMTTTRELVTEVCYMLPHELLNACMQSLTSYQSKRACDDYTF